jgi:hypothetical protein
MNRFKHLIPATMVLFSLVGLTQATPIIVNFDNIEVPSINNLDVVTTQWNGFGLGINNAYWFKDVRDPFDQMGLSIYPAGSSNIGRINFLNGPVSNLNVEWMFIVTGAPAAEYIDAYDSNNNLLSGFIGTSSNGTLWQSSNGDSYYGTVNFPVSNISYFTWSNTGGYASISGINFQTTAVPEPSTFALLGAGFAGGCFLKRQQKK